MDLNLCQNSVVIMSLNIDRDPDLTYSFFKLPNLNRTFVLVSVK